MVVFQDADGGWDEDFDRAGVYQGEDATAAALARARLDEARERRRRRPMRSKSKLRNGHYAPKALREAIRAAGPDECAAISASRRRASPHAGPHARMETPHVSL